MHQVSSVGNCQPLAKAPSMRLDGVSPHLMSSSEGIASFQPQLPPTFRGVLVPPRCWRFSLRSNRAFGGDGMSPKDSSRNNPKKDLMTTAFQTFGLYLLANIGTHPTDM